MLKSCVEMVGARDGFLYGESCCCVPIDTMAIPVLPSTNRREQVAYERGHQIFGPVLVQVRGCLESFWLTGGLDFQIAAQQGRR